MILEFIIHLAKSTTYVRIDEFRKGYQPETNLVKNENGDLLSESLNILNRWRKCDSYSF
jgi:hypothetical protein